MQLVKSATGSRRSDKTSAGVTDDNLKNSIIAQILKSASVPKWPNVYVIGTQSRRVNFSSQQTRALNLVWALWHSGKIKQKMNVCVVGGGLAGITSVAALISLGLRPTLFERGSEILFDQRLTHHRFVHPTLNFWPEQNLNPTTQLPFFDWFAGKCADVLDDIYDEWLKNFRPHVELRENSPVASIRSDKKNVTLRIKSDTGAFDAGPFDRAIVAIGFGGEAPIEGFPASSYWKPDDIETAHNSASSQYVVCGTGDGGLIDLFRLSFKLTFAQGKLIGDFGNAVAANPAAKRIAEAEAACEAETDDEASIHLASVYRSALSEVPPDALRVLQNALQNRMARRITLVGPLPSPFSPRAAPIHKLVLAYLAENNFFGYIQGKVISANAGIAVMEKSGKTVRFDYLIPRIGSIDSLAELAQGIDISSFINAQRAISDITNILYWKKPTIYLKGGGSVSSRRGASFVDDRILRARRISELYPSVGHLSRSPTTRGEDIIVAELHPNASSDLPNTPNHLFGVPLETRPALMMDIV